MFILNNMKTTTEINQKYALPNLNHLRLLNKGKSSSVFNNMKTTTEINPEYAIPNLNHLRLLNKGKSVVCINPFTVMMSLEKRPNNSTKSDTLSVLFFALACERIFIKMHRTESRCG